MKEINWSEFTRLIYINASIEELYQKWTTQEGMESWFLRSAPYMDSEGNLRQHNEACQAGDSYRWEWHNWEGEHLGKVIAANGRDHLIFDFESSDLEIKIYPGRGMTCVDLRQYNIAEDDQTKYKVYHGSSCGWTFWLTNLKALMEHGITLNDDQPGIIGIHSDFDVVNI